MAKVTGQVAGIVLAAGEGKRMGTPKALLTMPEGTTFLHAACDVLHASGCGPLIAVLGASATGAAASLPEELPVQVVLNEDWREGMSTSLRAGLGTVMHTGVDAALIHLVDLPDVGPAVMRRILHAGRSAAGGLASALVRAQYGPLPGHPVLIGREHFAGVLASLEGDAGARAYLQKHSPEIVDVSDLATGRDIDTPGQRLRFEEEYRA